MFKMIYPPPPPPKSLSNVQTKCNNDYNDSRWRNNERNQLGSWFSFSKPILEAFKIINILKIIWLMKV